METAIVGLQAMLVAAAAAAATPYLTLQDPRVVPADFSEAGSLAAALEEPGARGLALASADFNEDGMPDLVVSYDTPRGGMLSLHLGNVDAVYPNAPEARKRRTEGRFVDSPFLPEAKLFETKERADFLGAGDFDADGHWDVVAARRGGTSLTWHRGDGAGGLLPPGSLPLPGPVTALITGDVNRRDGLEDVVVGVAIPGGGRLLVFEGPDGALRWPPEEIAVASAVSDIAVGRIDDHFAIDFAVAAGSSLHIVHGRDRRLSVEEKPFDQPPPVVTEVKLRFEVQSVAIGDFDPKAGTDLALLDSSGRLSIVPAADLLTDPAGRAASIAPAAIRGYTAADPGGVVRLRRARVSTLPGDDLLLLGRGSGVAIRRLPEGEAEPAWEMAHELGAVAGALGMRLSPDPLEDLVLAPAGGALPTIAETMPLGIFSVTNTNDSGPGSLMQAILDANATPELDTIAFNIPGPGPHTIRVGPFSSLPVIRSPVTIDGTTEPDFAGLPVVELDGTDSNDSVLHTWVSVTIRGLVINRGEYDGIQLDRETSIIEGNFIGTDASGTAAAPNRQIGVSSFASDTIGGTTAAARNIISGNIAYGVFVREATDTAILGNYVGTDVTGSLLIANYAGGIWVRDSTGVSIGGTAAGSRNVITGGLPVTLGSTGGVLVQGNYIGTNAAATGPLTSSTHSGVATTGGFYPSSGNTVGGTTPAARNVIGGHGLAGVDVGFTSNFVQGNLIGVAPDGVTAIGNATGVVLRSGPNNVVGAFTASGRNVISGNDIGVELAGTDNEVLANYIGTSAAGSAAVPNDIGVSIRPGSTENRIGGASLPAANVISGNTQYGISLSGDANLVEVNLIGTDATGTTAVANGVGIAVFGAGNQIGVKRGQANVVSGNVQEGILLEIGSFGTGLQGNQIGTDVAGAVAIGNTTAVSIRGADANRLVDNVISGNDIGVHITGGSTTNTLTGNYIGTDLAGSSAMGNMTGVKVDSGQNVIGGAAAQDRNVISANGENVVVSGVSLNTIEGNYLGTNASGTSALGSGATNVALVSATSTVVRGNLIAGDYTNGLRLLDSTNTTIHGNFFGVNAAGGVLGTAGPAIRIGGGSSGNLVGGSGPGEGNVIAYSGDDGVIIEGVNANSIRGNSIHSNTMLGIDLGPDGVTFNDVDDTDVGANQLQNFPELVSAPATGGSVTVSGSLDSAPSTAFRVDFYASAACDPSGHGEGETPIGSTSVMTDGAGDGYFTAEFIAPVSAGTAITATATDPADNTSEFSACLTAVGAPPAAAALMTFDDLTGLSLSWDPVPGADLYELYRGTGATLAYLATQDPDSCLRATAANSTSVAGLTEAPASGQMHWFLLASLNQYGSSGVGEGSAGPRLLDSTGNCPTSACPHGKCATGEPLDPSCDPCVAAICQQDPHCCANAWDAPCVTEVRTVCGSLTCPESAGLCSHTLCTEGQPLVSKCDSPPLTPSCTAAICAQQPSCCQTSWGAACVAAVPQVCGLGCD